MMTSKTMHANATGRAIASGLFNDILLLEFPDSDVVFVILRGESVGPTVERRNDETVEGALLVGSVFKEGSAVGEVNKDADVGPTVGGIVGPKDGPVVGSNEGTVVEITMMG